jgi:glutathione S-transferase
MAGAALVINSRNYGAWSMRGWLLCRLAGLEVDVEVLPSDDPENRAELLLLAPSYRIPRLVHNDVTLWDTWAIAEYLNEQLPPPGLLPEEPADRALCRAISGEIHSGFVNLRSSLPLNLKSRHPGFRIWSGAQADIDRVVRIWHHCLDKSGGPFLFGTRPTMADAMYAPVCARFVSYDVALDDVCAAYRDHIMGLDVVQEWVHLAQEEPDQIEELDVEF